MTAAEPSVAFGVGEEVPKPRDPRSHLNQVLAVHVHQSMRTDTTRCGRRERVIRPMVTSEVDTGADDLLIAKRGVPLRAGS